jgi:hypothetical protein
MRNPSRLLILTVASVGASLLAAFISHASAGPNGPGLSAATSNSDVLLARADSDVDVDQDFDQALKGWQPPAAGKSAQGAKRESWFSDCRTGMVNFDATLGWCYEPRLKLFYNAGTGILLDPLTGRLFSFDQNLKKLHEIQRRTDESVEPPSFRLPRGAVAPPLSRTCRPDDSRLVDQHVAGLNANAARTDSPVMKQLFSAQARWWTERCHGH